MEIPKPNHNLPNELRGAQSRFLGRQSQFYLDLLILAAAFTLASLSRLDFSIPEGFASRFLFQLPLVVLAQVGALVLVGVYAFVSRYIGMTDVKPFLKAAFFSAAAITIFGYCLPDRFRDWRVPMTVIVTDTLLAFGSVLSLRVLWRAVHERNDKRREAGRHGGQKKRILLIGAGSAGVLAAKEIKARCDGDFDIRGFVDDDPRKLMSVIQQVKVRGTTEDLPRLVRELSIDHVIISIAHAPRENFRRILNICEQLPVKVQIIPGLYEIIQGLVRITRIRDVQIEDLLGREPVCLDVDDVGRFLHNKTVMVTGAGGSIGSEIARHVARFQPANLLLVERAEGALFNIEQELIGKHRSLPFIPLVADVGDAVRMRSIFNTYRPHVIFHAAAHKHVPLMEANAVEVVKNNILATRSLGEMAGEFKAEAFVMISTDKAVRPTSLMGASKRVAELVVQDLNRRCPTRYVAVRFGNVIGSAGSVIPIFQEQIRAGGPVTVTHPDMMRYFMTIPEASQLVLQAGAMGEGGEIFVLDMGKPVNILELAKDLITLSGFKPFEDIEIKFTGTRPGEKLYEELEITEENMSKTRHPKIFIGKIAAYPEEKVAYLLERLSALAQKGQDEEIRHSLGELLPEAQLGAESVPPAGTSSTSEAEASAPADAKAEETLTTKFLPA